MMKRLHIALGVFVFVGSLVHGQETEARIAAGPMVGYGTETEVRLWLQTTSPADVRIRFRPVGKPRENAGASDEKSAWARTDALRAHAHRAHCVHVTISDLPFGTTFEYEVELDGTVQKVDHRLRFRTQSHWNFRTEPPEFTAAIGSCAFVNDEPFDRPGRVYGNPDRSIYRAMARREPDLMLWLGDNLYYREPDWTAESAMRARYTKNRGIPELQPLLGATHHYAIWDDHDYGPNDSDRSFMLKDASLRTFRLFWANQIYGTRDLRGVFSRFMWGDVEFFLLDNRYHRSPNAAPDDHDKVMFGRPQLDWLLDGLTSSRAPFKIVCAGNQMLNPMVFYEGFRTFTHEHRWLMKELHRRRIEGVVFITGDRHQSEVIRIDRPNAYPLHDYTSSPLLSGLHDVKRELNNEARVKGTLVYEQRNFGELSFAGKRLDRVMTMRCLGEKGDVLWEHEIRARDLKYAR